MSIENERVHHPYSPSTLQNLEWCPHYRGRQQDTPHERTVAGTRAHGVAETGEDDSRLSDDDAIAAAECLDFVEQRRQLMQEEADRARLALGQMAGPNPLPEFFQVEEMKELYLPVDDLEFPDCKSTTAGYFDRVLMCRATHYAEGFDWKFGRWPVETPKDNLQVISYVLGIFKAYPTIDKIRFWIKQPLLEYVKDAVFERYEIPALYLRVQVVVAKARRARELDDFSMAKPAVPICNFCAEIGRCEKVCSLACKVGRKYHPVEIPESISPTGLQAPDQAAMGLRLAAVMKIWSEGFRRQITERILSGEQELPPGQKIQKMAKRIIVSLDKLKAVALKYITTAEFDATLETTFGAVEEKIMETAPRGQKKPTVDAFRAELKEVGAVAMGEEFSYLRAVATKE